MFRRSLLLVVLAVAFVGVIVRLSSAAETVSPWLNTGNPILEQTAQLPDSVLPSTSNSDCQKITTRFSGTTTMRDDCAVQTTYGMAGTGGIVFTGSSEAVAVIPPSPFVGLKPVLNQSLTYTYTSSSVIGLYIHFYRSIHDKLQSAPTYVNGIRQYTLTKPPDMSLRGSDGKPLSINPESLAFSQNGHWMVVDIPFQGFVRVNMATFEMLPFAPSLNQGSDYSSRNSQLSISPDGRYVAVKPLDYQYLRIYDLQSCSGAVLPVRPSEPKCGARDYWNSLTTGIPGLRTIYQPRFINASQLSFAAVHDYVSGSNFKVTQRVLTAPGEQATGMSYLGMGDSFAAGQGAFNYVAGTDTANNTCHLSSLSYPLLMSGDIFAGGRAVACSGAKTLDVIDTSDFYSGQVKDEIRRKDRNIEDVSNYLATFTPGFLAQAEFVNDYRPEVITLSVGGNDIGFADIVKACASPMSSDSSCFPTKEDQYEPYVSIQSVFDKLVQTYSTVKKPGKRVYVIGYPQAIASGGDCAVNVLLDARAKSNYRSTSSIT